MKEHKGNYFAKVVLPKDCRKDLNWWAKNITTETYPIRKREVNITLESDACTTGWGGCKVANEIRKRTGGNWTSKESQLHINYLELKAAWFVIQSFCKGTKNCHIRLYSDNTTTVSYLNNMGGTKKQCNDIAREIWLWCYENKNWISSAHLPGKDNVVADQESRSIHDNMEWKLHPTLFKRICDRWGHPEIDLFANRLNHQISSYVSWKPDPGAIAVDSLSMNWSSKFFYAFPPFNMIGKVLRKIEEENAKGLLVVPYWPTQTWFPKFLKMCVNGPCVLYRKDANPTLSHPWRKQASLPSTRMLAALVSATCLQPSKSLVQQESCYCHHGGKGHINNMEHI